MPMATLPRMRHVTKIAKLKAEPVSAEEIANSTAEQSNSGLFPHRSAALPESKGIEKTSKQRAALGPANLCAPDEMKVRFLELPRTADHDPVVLKQQSAQRGHRR